MAQTENWWKNYRFLAEFAHADSLQIPLFAIVRLASFRPWLIFEILISYTQWQIPPDFYGSSLVTEWNFVKITQSELSRSFSGPICSKLAACWARSLAQPAGHYNRQIQFGSCIEVVKETILKPDLCNQAGVRLITFNWVIHVPYYKEYCTEYIGYLNRILIAIHWFIKTS